VPTPDSHRSRARAVTFGRLLPHLPALVGLLLALLTCSTPWGAVRLGLEAVQLASSVVA
jgi:hypothetical protein